MEVLDLGLNLPIGHLGPSREFGPLPTVFYFALSIQESLHVDPYNQPTRFLESDKMRIFSFHLPFHGPNLNPVDAIGKWAGQFQQGIDPLTPFIQHVIVVIEELIARGWIDPEKIGFMGLSRGGLIATLVAAQFRKIAALVAFAPMIDLSFAKEFEGLKGREELKKFNLLNFTEELAPIPSCFYIGNRDVRVGTERCFQLVHSLAEAAYQKGLRSPPVEMIITPSIGHMGHGTSKENFHAGTQWLGKKLGVQ